MIKEAQLSTLLNDVEVVRPFQHRAILLQDYARRLASLVRQLDLYYQENPDLSFDQDLSGIQLIAEM